MMKQSNVQYIQGFEAIFLVFVSSETQFARLLLTVNSKFFTQIILGEIASILRANRARCGACDSDTDTHAPRCNNVLSFQVKTTVIFFSHGWHGCGLRDFMVILCVYRNFVRFCGCNRSVFYQIRMRSGYDSLK